MSDPDTSSPTIKGVFIKAHIQAVRQSKGEAGIKQLQTCFGGSLEFGNSQDVSILDEVKILECAVQIMSDHTLTPNEIVYQAGRLHFNNFSRTPLGKLILPFFRDKYKTILLRSKYIAEHVFKGLKFSSTEVGPKSVTVTMSKSDYPLAHFKGLFAAWMEYCHLKGTVDALETEISHIYHISWQ